ncbi:hypothetical protein PLEOSDRAFT_1047353 [Pleurotus ostreatus PC15]|uniref:Carbohydrate kinase PfkB domain-containing protein n=1 Tax=Pleurotus ostreatus (strain PC15) TaxID=1137138 RepID=A0A067NKW1_PLEO1|nr:hypothetical protein PLEOSDRAFT_1047353 [Pleurotus ostreatus PC15]
MAKLRRDVPDIQFPGSSSRPLRVVASGTLFQTYTLSIPSYPAPSTVTRAHSVAKTRGGSASTVLSLLAQFPAVEAVLVASLGGNDEGTMVLQDLEAEGVVTRYCKIWKHSGVPTAWVMHSAEDDTRTVVNHNPLPDITHEEFVSLLGPLVAPENYAFSQSAAVSPPTPAIPASASSTSPSPTMPSPRPSQSGPHPLIFLNPNSPAPFDWLHFEGRSVKTTLSNITGLDGLARERKWRSHCVFSVDVGRKGRQGVEALIPQADILFLNKHYAQTHSPHYATTPRAFLLSITSLAAPHALLVAYWGSEGAAALSVPTKEYFQSSGWVEQRPQPPPQARRETHKERRGRERPNQSVEIQSVRSGSDFWAGTRSRTPSSSAFTTSNYLSDATPSSPHPFTSPQSRSRSRNNAKSPGRYNAEEDDDNDSQGTEMPAEEEVDDGVVDEVGAQDAFVAGMIFALSRRIVPGAPYTPSSGKANPENPSLDAERGKWRLDECLRFATELAGRKARRRSWSGLAEEMARTGWLDG